MAAYLIDRPGTLRQFSTRDVRRITGCTVIHTAESVMDSVGQDTGAEAVAEFIRTRKTPGSYHDLADSDSYVHLVPYEHGAWQDGTGSNPWALSVSFACRTVDWRAMSPARRAGFLRQGARAFAAQQAWRKAHGLPLTLLRRITRAQSDAGLSGCIAHGDRDPARRSDPGTRPPDLFPWGEFFAACALALGGLSDEEDDLMALYNNRSELRTDVANATWENLRWQVPGTDRKESPRVFLEQTRVEAVRAAMAAARAEALARVAAEGAGVSGEVIDRIIRETTAGVAARLGDNFEIVGEAKIQPKTAP